MKKQLNRILSILLAMSLALAFLPAVALAAPGGADLSALTISDGALSPAFDPAATAYTASVAGSVASVTVTATAADAAATVAINGVPAVSGSPSDPISLSFGDNVVTVDVTAADGLTTNSYSITVTRLSNDASILSVDVSNYIDTVSAVIDEAAGTVKADVYGQDQSIMVTLSSPAATYVIDNTLVENFALLNPGENVFPITVTAQDGTVKVYTMTLNRLPSQDATLAYLWVAQEGGTDNVSAVIDNAADTVSATVSGQNQSVSMQPTVATSTYVVKQNGNVVPTQAGVTAVSLALGDNVFTVEVMADDGTTTKTYTLTLTRTLSSSTDFSAYINDPSGNTETTLPFAGSSSQEAAVSGANHYLLIVPASQAATFVVKDQAGNALQQGQQGYGLALAMGANSFTIEATAEDGSKTVSTLTLTRATSSDNTLAQVQVTTPADNMTSLATVDNTANTVKLTTYGAGQTLKIQPSTPTAAWALKQNGTALPSSQGSVSVTLSSGANTFSLEVTAENGDVRTYAVTLTRTLSTNPTLQSVLLNSNTSTTTATVNEAAKTAKATVTSSSQYISALPKERMTAAAILDAASSDVQNQTVTLARGDNLYTIQMTAENGATRTYQFTVTLLQRKVSFDSQGGGAVADVYTDYNTTIAAPADPQWSGYDFAGWYRDAALTKVWNFATDKVNADITLYAKWTPVAAVPAAPAAPVAKAASASYASVKVSWAAIPGASGYEVYSAAAPAGPWNLVSSTAGTFVVDTGLTLNKVYYYKVRAYAAAGGPAVYGDYSAVVSARPVPGAPGSFRASAASYKSIRLTWAAVTGATAYDLYRATSAAGPFKLLATTRALSYVDTVNTGTAYYYIVKATRYAGATKVSSPASSTAYAKARLAVPASVKAARASSSRISVRWAAVAGASGYEVYRSTTSPRSGFSLRKATSGLSFTNTGLTKGRTYYYKVRAYRMVGSVKVYSDFTVVVSARP